MSRKKEIAEEILELFDVIYGEDDSPYPFDRDFVERMEILAELMDELEEGPLKQGIIEAFKNNMDTYLPFGEWTHYDTINAAMTETHSALCEAVDKYAE